MHPTRAALQQLTDIDKPEARATPGTRARGRINWFDYAKGICIILVVMMHSTLGVGEAFAEHGLGSFGFMHHVVAYAKPFRMPDFFLLSGLFLSLAIGRTWLHYLDKKLVHFAYFYVIWTVIQATIKTTATAGLDMHGLLDQFLSALVNPFPTLWFIYVLPMFFLVTKILHRVPGWAMLVGAAVLQMLPVQTGWYTMDHFIAPYYVFFLAGYLLASHVFAIADWTSRHSALAIGGVAVWAMVNGVLAYTASPFARWEVLSDLPVVSLVLGGMGGMAIVTIASQLAKFNIAGFVRYCGRNSIVLYISFAIPMAVTRVILLKTGVITDVGIASAVVWLVALVSPLVVHIVARHTPLRWLYERPAWFALPYRKTVSADNSLASRLDRVVGLMSPDTCSQA